MGDFVKDIVTGWVETANALGCAIKEAYLYVLEVFNSPILTIVTYLFMGFVTFIVLLILFVIISENAKRLKSLAGWSFTIAICILIGSGVYHLVELLL